jgi:hypothetical protein
MRIAESNAKHHQLQKQRGKELKDMIPDAFLEEAKSVEGSNRDLIHTMNATKLYIANLIKDKVQLQLQLGEGQHVSMDAKLGCDEDDDPAQGGHLLRSNAARGNDTNMRTRYEAMVAAVGAVNLSGLETELGRYAEGWPEARDDDGTLPITPTPDIAPHDALLRQAVEKFIALVKERIMASQGVLDKKEVDRLSTIHDCIVDMVEDIRKG